MHFGRTEYSVHVTMATDIWRSRFTRASDIEFRELLERLPVAAYTTDADGLIAWFRWIRR